MEINIEDYFSEAEIKQIVEEEIRNDFRQKLRETDNRLIVNGIYHRVAELVDQEIAEDPSLKDIIVEKTKGVITKLSNYSVFHKADAWEKRQGRTDSLGQQILEEEVAKRRERIGGRVQKLMDEMTYRDVKELVLNSVEQMFFVHEEDKDD